MVPWFNLSRREIISEVLLSQEDPEQGHGYQNYKVSVPQGDGRGASLAIDVGGLIPDIHRYS